MKNLLNCHSVGLHSFPISFENGLYKRIFYADTIEETKPTCDYFPFNYSPYDLSQWSSEGLYIEVDESVKQKYISKYLKLIN